MTICNMAVEAGARGAFMAPDEKVFAYLKDKPRAPEGAVVGRGAGKWRELRSDPGAVFDREIDLDASALEPMVTWGTSPDQASDRCPVPDPQAISDPILRQDMRRALNYMGLKPACRSATSSSAMPSSAPAPTRGSKICAMPPASFAGSASPSMCGR